jgi:hypothetical protein
MAEESKRTTGVTTRASMHDKAADDKASGDDKPVTLTNQKGTKVSTSKKNAEKLKNKGWS